MSIVSTVIRHGFENILTKIFSDVEGEFEVGNTDINAIEVKRRHNFFHLEKEVLSGIQMIIFNSLSLQLLFYLNVIDLNRAY